MFYSDRKVDRKLVRTSIIQSMKTTPGKNNAMVYQARYGVLINKKKK